MLRIHNVLQRFLVPAMMAFLPVSAFAGSQVVWQIGRIDKSTLEYAEWVSATAVGGGAQCGDGKHAFVPETKQGTGQAAFDLVYVIGKSQTAEWPCFQAGSSNGLEGYRPHPYAIQFDLPTKPRGLYTLKVSLLVKSPRVSRLEVSINGHRGLYFQHPVLDYNRGDDEGFYMPNYSADTINAELPTQFLRQGTNELVLTAIDDLPKRDDVTDSGIYYDALAMQQDAEGKYSPSALTVDVQPTIFYLHKDGSLDELVDVFVRNGSSLSDGEVALSMGGASYTAKLPSGWEFGEQMVEFTVPEFPAGTKGEVTVQLARNAQRVPVTLVPARKWHFFIVPNVHLDIGYTDYQGKVAEIQSRILDEAIDLTQEHPKFRFSADAFWSVQQFMAWRSDAQKEHLIQAVKEKKIFVPTQEANLLTGFASLEVLLRSLYPGFEFHQKFGGDANYANITDVPSYSWSYASALSAAGLKYFIAASNNDRAPVLLQGHLHEDSPFWWEGPDGGRVLMWYSRHYHQVWSMFKLPPSIEGGHDSLPLFTQIYSRPGYKSDSILVYGTQAENSDLFPQQATFVDEWNNAYAYPQMSYSGFVEALTHIAGQFGDSIPVVRGDGGPYWEDGIASTARSAAVERENEQRALAAEKFATLSSVVNPRLHPDADAFKRLWANMVLYDEHTWTYYAAEKDPHRLETEQQLATKENFANEAKRGVDDVMRRSLAALADSISDPHGTLLVFNPLSWQRSSLVEVDLDKGKELVDLETGQTVPYETLSSGRGYLHVRFLARDMPSVGYKAYAIRSAPQSPVASPISMEPVIENRYYRVVLDPQRGAVKSIFDKELNQELVSSSSPYRFNQYLYVTGGDKEPNRSIKATLAAPLPDYSIHGAGDGRIVSVTDQPYGVVGRLESHGVNTPKIESEIILFNNQKKIEFIDRVHKTEVFTKEGVYFAFPLAMAKPHFRYETQNGFVDPSRDQMPGAAKEWFSVQHWVAADDGPVSVVLAPVDASLICLGNIFRATWPTQFGQRPGTIFSYVMNNYWDTNYAPGQGGDFTFRYVLTSGQHMPPASLSRFGREEMTPMEVDQITEEDKSIDSPRPLSGASGSFVQVSQPNVVLATWKMAEDGDGTIMRFLETGDQTNTVEVQVPYFEVKSAWTADALERKQDALKTSAHGFQFSVKPFQIVTVRLEGTGKVR
jgi:hypothetical protein